MELNCIRCGEAGFVKVDIQNGDEMKCESCENEYTRADVRGHIGCWETVLKWLDTHPAQAVAPLTLKAAK